MATATRSEEATFEKLMNDVDDAVKIIQELVQENNRNEAIDWYRELIDTAKVFKQRINDLEARITGYNNPHWTGSELQAARTDWEKKKNTYFEKLKYVQKALRKVEKLLREKGWLQ